MPSQIRVNYEQLVNISQQFIDSANQGDLISQQMNACLDDIRAAWQADGVEPFISRLFDRIVSPLDTLRNALDETSFTIDQISQIMADAETEASQLFTNVWDDTSARNDTPPTPEPTPPGWLYSGLIYYNPRTFNFLGTASADVLKAWWDSLSLTEQHIEDVLTWVGHDDRLISSMYLKILMLLSQTG